MGTFVWNPSNLLCTIGALPLLTLNLWTGQKNWESHYDPGPRTLPGVTKISKPTIKTMPVIGGFFWMTPETIDSLWHRSSLLLKKISVNYTTGKTPYEIVFDTKLQIPLSLEHGLYRNKRQLCCSEFCKNLPSHSFSENNVKNQLFDNILRQQLSNHSWNENAIWKGSILLLSKDVEKKQPDRMPTEIVSSWVNT